MKIIFLKRILSFHDEVSLNGLGIYEEVRCKEMVGEIDWQEAN